MTRQANWFANDLDEIPRRVAEELEAAAIEPGRPLLAVDADEVLVHFARHFGAWLESLGYAFKLTEYRLDTAIRGPRGEALTRAEIQPLVWDFIEAETRRQPAVDGAAETLARLSREAQVVVVTNAPAKVRACRVANLAGLGMDYPVVMNEGGKGRALRWLADRAAAPVAFVDDSADQLASVARHAAEAARLHLVGCETLRPIVGRAESADHHVEDWRAAEETIRRALGL